MSSTPNGAATIGGADPADVPPNTLTLGGRQVTIERPSSLKASRALAMMRGLSNAAPALQTELATFRVRYEAENFVELDRVQARVQYPERPIMAGGAIMLDEDGAPRMLPSPVDRISEEDWEKAGGKLRVPASPAQWEVVVALLDSGIEAVETLVYRFLALFTIPNADLKAARADGTLDAVVRAAADELLDDTYADELLELAVVVNETIDHHFRRKARFLGDRLGKLLSMLPGEFRSSSSTETSTSSSTTSQNGTTPESPRPSSSTDSPPDTTAGLPPSSSTPPMTSSSTSASSSKPTSSESDAPVSDPDSPTLKPV